MMLQHRPPQKALSSHPFWYQSISVRLCDPDFKLHSQNKERKKAKQQQEKKKNYCSRSPDSQNLGEGGEFHALGMLCGYSDISGSRRSHRHIHTHTRAHTSLCIRHHGGGERSLALACINKIEPCTGLCKSRQGLIVNGSRQPKLCLSTKVALAYRQLMAIFTYLICQFTINARRSRGDGMVWGRALQRSPGDAPGVSPTGRAASCSLI